MVSAAALVFLLPLTGIATLAVGALSRRHRRRRPAPSRPAPLGPRPAAPVTELTELMDLAAPDRDGRPA